MKDFVQFLIKHSFDQTISISEHLIEDAFIHTIKDVSYHYAPVSNDEVYRRIINNNSELSIFLFRLGQLCFKSNNESHTYFLHGLIRQYCCCEFYFSSEIDTGFYPVHGVSSVIGSRCKIGKGFLIYHNCTLGHLFDGERGCTIGDQVTMFPGSMVLGNVLVGSDVVIGANSIVFSDIPSGCICTGNPAKIINDNSLEEMKRHREYLRNEKSNEACRKRFN